MTETSALASWLALNAAAYVNEVASEFWSVQVVNPQTAFDSDGNLHPPLYFMYDVPHFLRRFHQRSAETA